MANQDFDTATLATYLHITPTQVQKLAERGNVPGRKIAGVWRFSKGEIHHWLEERIGAAGQADLQHVQTILDRAAANFEAANVTISELLLPEAVAIPLQARTRGSVVKAMVELAAKTGMVWDSAEIAEAVQAREKLHPTALDNGVAMLHPRRPLPHAVGQPLLALGRTSSGVPFGSESGQLTDIFFLICSVDDSQHLRTLARLSRLVTSPGFLEAIRSAESAAEVITAVKDFEGQLVHP